jgi:hypothetical protein
MKALELLRPYKILLIGLYCFEILKKLSVLETFEGFFLVDDERCADRPIRQILFGILSQ